MVFGGDKLSNKINNIILESSDSALDFSKVAGSYKSLTNAYLEASSESDLPDPTINVGRFVYIQDTKVFKYSDGTSWITPSRYKSSINLFSWGYNSNGGLGNGTTVNRCSPGSVIKNEILTKWVDLSSGDRYSTIAVKSDGTLWSWGRNNCGQLGNGITLNRCSPGTVISQIPVWLSGGSSLIENSFAVKCDGTLWSWGCNCCGALGNGTTVNRCSPGTVAGGGTIWCQVSGSSHGSGIKCDGTLWTWGTNTCGQLGDGTTVSRCSPGEIKSEWNTISSGYDVVGAIKCDGTLWTWGVNVCGVLGDGTTVSRCSPGTIAGGGTTWCQVSIVFKNTASAIKTDGTLWTWGTNSKGQLGDGTTVSRCSPGTIAGGGTTWCQVFQGCYITSAIKTDGTLWTWGCGFYGGLGDGTTVDRCSPGTVFGGGTTWTRLAGGRYHVLALKNDGTLWSWGNNYAGVLGDGTTSRRCSPGTVAGGGTTWCQIGCGTYHSVAVKTDGTLWTWGKNSAWQLGNGNTVTRCSPGTTSGGGTTWCGSSGGTFGTIAIKTDGTLWSWGVESVSGSGVGDRCSPGTVAGGGTNWLKISAGFLQGSAIKTNGTLWTWGRNNKGQLGDGNTTLCRCSPGTIAEPVWCQVSNGLNHTSAIKTDGTLWTWGANTLGKLGDGTTVSRCSPGTIAGGGTAWYKICSAKDHISAIKTNGSIWTWGINTVGQLGDGTTVNRCSPGSINGGFTSSQYWCNVSVGCRHSAGVKCDGTLWTWGYNAQGQLGDGGVINRNCPGTVAGGGTTWKLVATSSPYNSTFGIKTDGTLWTWGNNISGQLGSGESIITSRCSPGTVAGGGTTWCQVSSGQLSASAIKTDGTLWTWGNNCCGRLGDGTTVSRCSPGTVAGGGTTWCQVSDGTYHIAAIKTDGTLWTWGRASEGGLGAGPGVTSRCSPGTIAGGGTTWSKVSAAYSRFNVALKTDGTLWTWGYGGSGQLGSGSAVFCTDSPGTVAGGGTTWCQICAGGYAASAIKTDGTLWTWGRDQCAVLGNDSPLLNTSSPGTVAGGGTTWSQVSFGYQHAMATKSDGTLWGWGDNRFYQLGLGRYSAYEVIPKVVSTLCGNFKDVSNLDSHSISITKANEIFVWGCNGQGRLGDGTTLNRCSPVQLNVSSKVSISNVLLGAASLESSTTPSTGNNDDGYWELNLPWEINYFGSLQRRIFVGTNNYFTFDNGDTVYYNLSSSNPVVKKIMISAADNSIQRIYYGVEGTAPNRTYRIRTEGTAGTSGTLGFPNIEFELTFFENDTKKIEIQIGSNARSSGLSGFFDESDILLELTSTPFTGFRYFMDQIYVPKRIFSGSSFSSLLVGISSKGSIFSWGGNNFGQLGNGTTVDRCSPGTIVQNSSLWREIFGNINQISAINVDKVLWSWGNNSSGQLGNYSITSRCSPGTVLQPLPNSLWTKVSSGEEVHFSIKSDGTLWSWGCNAGGQLGDGTTVNKCSPIQVFGDCWSNVFAGCRTVLGIKCDGTIWTWGSNTCGALGNGTTVSRCSPGTVAGGGTTWCQGSVGSYSLAAIKTDGTLWTWGNNICGALGNGTTVSRCSPGTIWAGGTTWRQVSSGRYNMVAIVGSFGLSSWGNNASGALGNGTTVTRCSPGNLPSAGYGWCSVSSSNCHTSAIKTDGTLWTWGSNNCGQLGDGTTVSRCSPGTITISGIQNSWTKTDTGKCSTFALRGG